MKNNLYTFLIAAMGCFVLSACDASNNSKLDELVQLEKQNAARNVALDLAADGDKAARKKIVEQSIAATKAAAARY